MLPDVHPNAAGIVISASMHMVAVPTDRDEQSIRKFGCAISMPLPSGFSSAGSHKTRHTYKSLSIFTFYF
jgi:hypothetical protein